MPNDYRLTCSGRERTDFTRQLDVTAAAGEQRRLFGRFKLTQSSAGPYNYANRQLAHPIP